jgi:hypothetical protein
MLSIYTQIKWHDAVFITNDLKAKLKSLFINEM